MWRVTITDRNGKTRIYNFLNEPEWNPRGRTIEGRRTTSVVPNEADTKKIYIQIAVDESMVAEEL